MGYGGGGGMFSPGVNIEWNRRIQEGALSTVLGSRRACMDSRRTGRTHCRAAAGTESETDERVKLLTAALPVHRLDLLVLGSILAIVMPSRRIQIYVTLRTCVHMYRYRYYSS